MPNQPAQVAPPSTAVGVARTPLAVAFYTRARPLRQIQAHYPAMVSTGHDVTRTIGGRRRRLVFHNLYRRCSYFWNDADGTRYHTSYFDTYPGVWRHGDLVRITERGSSVISGRSDSTLNPHGIRIGTSEIYRSVEGLEEVADSMVVHLDADEDDARLPLFVVLREGSRLDEQLVARIKKRIREERSPRHVPDGVHQVPTIHTR